MVYGEFNKACVILWVVLPNKNVERIFSPSVVCCSPAHCCIYRPTQDREVCIQIPRLYYGQVDFNVACERSANDTQPRALLPRPLDAAPPTVGSSRWREAYKATVRRPSPETLAPSPLSRRIANSPLCSRPSPYITSRPLRRWRRRAALRPLSPDHWITPRTAHPPHLSRPPSRLSLPPPRSGSRSTSRPLFVVIVGCSSVAC